MPSGGSAPDQDDGRSSRPRQDPIDLVDVVAETPRVDEAVKAGVVDLAHVPDDPDHEGVIDLEMLAWNLGAILDDRGHLLPVSLLDYLR